MKGRCLKGFHQSQFQTMLPIMKNTNTRLRPIYFHLSQVATIQIQYFVKTALTKLTIGLRLESLLPNQNLKQPVSYFSLNHSSAVVLKQKRPRLSNMKILEHTKHRLRAGVCQKQPFLKATTNP